MEQNLQEPLMELELRLGRWNYDRKLSIYNNNLRFNINICDLIMIINIFLINENMQGGSGYAKNIIFKNIAMSNVSNPIIINQNYCDRKYTCKEQDEQVI